MVRPDPPPNTEEKVEGVAAALPASGRCPLLPPPTPPPPPPPLPPPLPPPSMFKPSLPMPLITLEPGRMRTLEDMEAGKRRSSDRTLAAFFTSASDREGMKPPSEVRRKLTRPAEDGDTAWESLPLGCWGEGTLEWSSYPGRRSWKAARKLGLSSSEGASRTEPCIAAAGTQGTCTSTHAHAHW
jgi:hypothetical protein